MEDKHLNPPQPPLIEAFYNTSLPRLRIGRFRQIHIITLGVSYLYSLFVIFTTPSDLSTKIILLTIGTSFGLTLLGYFYFTQDQEFTDDKNLYVTLGAIATLLAAVQISGGIESPFLFFYLLIILFAAFTLATREAFLTAGLVGLLLIIHAIMPSIDLLEIKRAGALNFFLITWGRILIAGGYILFLIGDLIKKDDRLLQTNSRLEGEIANLKKFNLLTKTYQSLSTLRGTLNYGTLTQLIPMTLAKLLNTEVTLLFLKEGEDLEYVSSWSKKTEGVIKGASFRECLESHGSSCIVNRLTTLEKMVNLDSAKLVEDCSPECSDLLSSLGSKYFVLLPLKVADKPLGAIIMGFGESRQFAWEELEVIRIFTYTTVLALENSRFYSKTRENFERYNAILTELIDAVVVVDKDDKILLFNEQAAKLFNWPASEAVGKSAKQVLVALDESEKRISESKLPQKKALGESGVITTPKLFYKKPNGDLVPATVSAKSIKDEAGKSVGVMLLIRNLTPQIEFERARNEFISVASRELRVPIEDMKEFLKRIKEDKGSKLSSRQKNFLELAYQSNERQIRLVDDLLRVSQIEKGKVRVKKKPIDLSNTTKTVVEDFIYQARRKKQQISYDLPKKPLKVKADPTHVREVLALLLGNAVKYTKWGGEITVSHDIERKVITTHVKDSGPPINKEVFPNLFKKFYRAPDVAKKVEGTGLGLYAVKQLVEMMGGTVNVQSNSKIGVDFSFSLPKG